jgi:hypothetical protein
MTRVTLILLLLINSCATKPTVPAQVGPVIRMTEVGPNKWTALTRQNLEQLLQVYDLRPYLLTLDIQIQSQAFSQTQPILTLNTRFAEQPNKLLAVFIHEQLHWWATTKSGEINKAIGEIKSLLPKVPEKELGTDENLAYLETIICFFEYKTMIQLLNKKEANKVLRDFIHTDKVNPWINTQVYLKFKAIEAVLKKHKISLIPAR